MKKLSLMFAMFLFATSSIAKESVQDILELHAQSLGDLNAWRSVNSVSYELEIKEPSFTVDAIYRATRDGKMRIDIYADGKRVFTEAYDGTQAWEWMPKNNQPVVLDEEKEAALRHGVEMPGHIFTLLDMGKNGHKLEYVGTEEREDKPHHVLLLTLKDKHKKYYVIHPENGRIIANRDTRAFHPSIDDTKVLVESRPLDYHSINNMIRPLKSKSYDLTNEKWLAETSIKRIVFDEEIEDEFFSLDHIEDKKLEN